MAVLLPEPIRSRLALVSPHHETWRDVGMPSRMRGMRYESGMSMHVERQCRQSYHCWGGTAEISAFLFRKCPQITSLSAYNPVCAETCTSTLINYLAPTNTFWSATEHLQTINQAWASAWGVFIAAAVADLPLDFLVHFFPYAFWVSAGWRIAKSKDTSGTTGTS